MTRNLTEKNLDLESAGIFLKQSVFNFFTVKKYGLTDIPRGQSCLTDTEHVKEKQLLDDENVSNVGLKLQSEGIKYNGPPYAVTYVHITVKDCKLSFCL